MEHETPSVKIFNEIKQAAKLICQNNYSDEYGYVTEKTAIIDSIENYADNVMCCYRMFDSNNQQKMRRVLSAETIQYIHNNC